MKRSVDWHYLRSAIFIVSLLLILSVTLIYVGYTYHQGMLEQHSLKSAEFSDVKMQLEELKEDKEIISIYLDNFKAMEKDGLFNAKHRVDWVDTVNEARRKMKLSIVRYQIFPQEQFSAAYLLNEGLVDVVSSKIKLEAGLLHEGDLADLFGWMDQHAPGQIHFSSCNLKRVETVFGYYSHGPNLSVECELDWFSIIPLEQS